MGAGFVFPALRERPWLCKDAIASGWRFLIDNAQPTTDYYFLESDTYRIVS